jgi:hypothetical protein
MLESVAMGPETIDAAEAADRQRNKVRWSDLSPRVQTAIVVGGIAELVMTTIAVADLARRPATQVRGSKLLWLGTFVVQPVGPILYFLAGRRPTAR